MDIFDFLDSHGIGYRRYDHPAVFTAAEAERLVPPMPGIRTKNLFLRDRRRHHHFLVIVPAAAPVDLRALSEALGCGRLSFASPTTLERMLGVTPGSVSFLAICNDPDAQVEVVFDERAWGSKYLQCHPLVNTSTLLIPHAGIERILQLTGHGHRVITVPERQRDGGA